MKLHKASKKPPRSNKKFQGRNPYNISVAILVKTMTPKRHFEINWPLKEMKMRVKMSKGHHQKDISKLTDL